LAAVPDEGHIVSMTTTRKPDRSVLAAVPVFHGLDEAALDTALDVAKARFVAKNATAFEQGDKAETFYVLVDGRLKVSQTTSAGQQVVIRYIGPGEFFGCVAISGQAEYPGTATAVVDSVAVGWDAAASKQLMERFPTFAMNALKTMGTRVQEAHSRIREMSTEQVEQRVARAILRLAQQAGQKVDEGVRIEFPLTREDIAQMTGTTLHTVSRILSRWEEEGVISGGRQQVTIRKPHALVTIAERVSA
jgi:CRP/FNR family transcriptional regulator, nitrogen oxide reductase regulator